MLYMATQGDVPVRSSPELRVEEVQPSYEAVRQWFSLPVVRFVGAHTGCSCGFPHVIAQEPFEYFDGMFDDGENRTHDLASARSLLALIREQLTTPGEVQLYPVWNGEEATPPRGERNLRLETLSPETLVLNEQIFYRVTAS